MPEPGIKELLEAGLHFGHQTRRWNPRMARYIFGERDGIHIIDLMQTEKLLSEARRFSAEVAAQGGSVLFVGTKKQARDAVAEWAGRSGMPFVNQRWLGGLLTNFQTISARIERLHELNNLKAEGKLELLPTKERMTMESELERLEFNLGGVRDMKRLPQAVLVLDLKTEAIAVREAQRLRIPIIGLVDTNVDPIPVTYAIPGNDDAIRSCRMVVQTIGEAIEDSANAYREAEAKRRAEEEERRRREAEEKARQEAAEKARKEAEEAAAAAAAEGAPAQPAPAGAEGGAGAPPCPRPTSRLCASAPERACSTAGQRSPRPAATSTRRSRSCASRARLQLPSAAAGRRARARSRPTSTRGDASGCSSRCAARRTSSLVARTSRISPARWPSTSPARHRCRSSSRRRRSPRRPARLNAPSTRRRPARRASPTK